MNPQKQERSPDYTMRHAPERIVSIPAILYKQEKKRKLDLEDHAEKLKPDQVDALLLSLMSLATQYLLTPKSKHALQRELGNVAILHDLQGKNGEDLLAAFENLELTTHTATPQRAPLRKPSTQLPLFESGELETPTLEPLMAVRAGLRERMLDILRHPLVRKKYEDVLTQEANIKKTAKTPLGAISRLENIRKHSKQQLRALRAGEILSSEIRPGGKRASKTPGIAPDVAKNLFRVVFTAQAEKKKKEAVLTDEARGLYMTQRLLDYKEQLDTTGFAMTPSRESLMDEIADLAAQGFRVFLGGPTGTGKTKLGLFALKELTGGEYEVISWTGETGIRDLFGAPKIIATERGMETAMQKGGYTKAIVGEKSGVLQEEITTGRTGVQISLKALWAARPGEAISITGFNGSEFTKEQLIEIATGNLRGRRHEEREEMDPAIAREFKALEVPFMPAEEMRDIILAQNTELAGFVGISKGDIEMIDSLCKAAELSQLVYLEKLSADIKEQAFYSLISPTKDDIHLTKVFLDTGTTQDLFASWRTSGKSLSEFLQDQVQRFIFNNPHFSELESERTNMVKILKAFGFDLTPSAAFYTPKNKKVSKIPYTLPSELGFLIKPPKQSDGDEFAPTDADSENKGEWKEKEYQGETYRYKEMPFTNESGVLFEPGNIFTMEVGTKKIRMKFYGVMEDGTPLSLPFRGESGRARRRKGIAQDPPGAPDIPPPEGSLSSEDLKKISAEIQKRTEGTPRVLFSSAGEIFARVDDIFNNLFIPVVGIKSSENGEIVWPRLVEKLAERPLSDRQNFVKEFFKDFPTANELIPFINSLWRKDDFFGNKLEEAKRKNSGVISSQDMFDSKLMRCFNNFQSEFAQLAGVNVPSDTITVRSITNVPGGTGGLRTFFKYRDILNSTAGVLIGDFAARVLRDFIYFIITSIHKIPDRAVWPFNLQGHYLVGRENLPIPMKAKSLHQDLLEIAEWGGLYLGVYDDDTPQKRGPKNYLYIPELSVSQ